MYFLVQIVPTATNNMLWPNLAKFRNLKSVIRKLCSHIIIRLGETPDRVSSLLEERCVSPVGGRGSIPRGGFPHTHTEREGRGETTSEDSSELLGYSTI
jgi:hypothetical protein